MSRLIKRTIKGFTLIEMMVAITVFLIITLSSMGLIATMMTAQRKSQAEQDYVVNISESIFTIKNLLRKYTGYKVLDLGASNNFGPNSACNGAAGYSESIGMLDDQFSNLTYILTTQKIQPIASQPTVRIIMTTSVDLADPDKYVVLLPLVKDLNVYSVCFKPIGDGDQGATTVHPRVTAVIKAQTVPSGDIPQKDYIFQLTVESRNVVNIQNVYNSTWE